MTRMFRFAAIGVAIGAAMFASRSARAQDRPVEQGVADIDPLRQSLRVISPDLRTDDAFEHLYRLDANDPTGPFYRRAGGIYAVFPQSVYYETKQGVYAGIPAGTVFHFGKPGTDPIPGNGAPPEMSLSIDRLRLNETSTLRQQGRMAPRPLTGERLSRIAPPTDERNKPEAFPIDRPPISNPGVMSDEQYRSRRLAQIAARHAAPGTR